jgi:serine protease Do
MRFGRHEKTRTVVIAMGLALVVAAGTRADRALTPQQERRMTPVVDVVQRTLSSVVNISTTRVVKTREMGRGAFGTFPNVFDVPEEMRTNSVGSGSIIHPAGYVLTNAHVVAQADELFVHLSDGQKLAARLVASLPSDDVAVLKVEHALPLPAVSLGRSDDLLVGETAIAIGNPVGLGHTVTTGIVSALNRELNPVRAVTFTGIIQTDAAINPGNSGGPLLNILGEQIGVTTAIRADVQNVGFAIPIDRVKALLPTILAVEKKGRFALGLTLGPEPHEVGVVIAGVTPGSPAERAGLTSGSVITRIGAVKTGRFLDALVSLQEQSPGVPFLIFTVDGEAEREHRVVIEKVPAPDGQKIMRERFGLKLTRMSRERAQQLHVKPDAALVVEGTIPGSEAAQIGFRNGDLISRIGPYGVHTLEQVGLLLENVKTGDDVAFRVLRVERTIVTQADVVLRAR